MDVNKKVVIFLSLLLVLVFSLGFSSASSFQLRNASSTVTSSGFSGSDSSWSDTNRISTSNNQYASSSLGSSGDETDYLKATNFSFNIPNNATIKGIVVWVERQCSSSNSCLDNRIRIVKGGTTGSVDKSGSSSWSTSDTTQTYGGNTDLWGLNWTVADINSTNFGFSFSVKRTGSSGGSRTVKVDQIQMAVYYDEVNNAPVLTVPSNINWVEATSSSGAIVVYSPVTANDTEDGTITNISCNHASGSMYSIGTTTVTCIATDSAGLTSTKNFNITVQDTTKPAITLHGSSLVWVLYGNSYTDEGAYSSDLVDVNQELTGVSNVNVNVLGNYSVVFNDSDSHGNIADIVTRTVTVYDGIVPIITLNGSADVYVGIYESYSDDGATATDDYDGDITSNITVGGDTIDTNTLGDYIITYDVNDSSGNSANQIIRTVHVVDNQPPVIILYGSNPVYVPHHTTYVDEGAYASDAVEGEWNISDDTSYIDTNVLGTYTVDYTSMDSSGNNASTAIRTVIVYDGVKPILDLNGDADVYIGAYESYSDDGATATDDYDGDITSNITVGGDTIDTNTLGDYIITYDVNDSSGNSANQIIRTVHVVDNQPPVITLTGSNEVDFGKGQTYFDLGATATDDFDSNVTVNINDSGVDTNAVGTYYVIYTAMDSSGNNATPVIRTVKVGIVDEEFGAQDCADVLFTLLPGNISVTLNFTESEHSTDFEKRIFQLGSVFCDIKSDNLTNGQFKAKITFNYKDDNDDGIVDFTNIFEKDLNVYYFDGADWNIVPNPIIDDYHNTITVNVDHFTVFALMDPWASNELSGWTAPDQVSQSSGGSSESSSSSETQSSETTTPESSSTNTDGASTTTTTSSTTPQNNPLTGFAVGVGDFSKSPAGIGLWILIAIIIIYLLYRLTNRSSKKNKSGKKRLNR